MFRELEGNKYKFFYDIYDEMSNHKLDSRQIKNWIERNYFMPQTNFFKALTIGYKEHWTLLGIKECFSPYIGKIPRNFDESLKLNVPSFNNNLLSAFNEIFGHPKSLSH